LKIEKWSKERIHFIDVEQQNTSRDEYATTKSNLKRVNEGSVPIGRKGTGADF
jgi:hypothetical protein